MRVDAHQHFWEYAPDQYPWMGEPLAKLRRHFLPPDLLPELSAAGLHGSVAVQARQSLEESRWLLELADHHPQILGVVGWVDLCSKQVASQLESLAPHSKWVGVRHVLQDEPDDAFMLQPNFQRGIGLLKDFGLVYDLLVFPRQLPAALELVKRFPEQSFVIDHLAKPLIADQIMEPWKTQMLQMAAYPNVSCKLSGMVTEARWGDWSPEDLHPYLNTVIDCFGPKRLLYGSDWPVCLLAADYQRVHAQVTQAIATLSSDEQEAIMGANACRIYGLNPTDKPCTPLS